MHYSVVIALKRMTLEARANEIVELLEKRGFEFGPYGKLESYIERTEWYVGPVYVISGETKTLTYVDVSDIPDIEFFTEHGQIEVFQYRIRNGKEWIEKTVFDGPNLGALEQRDLRDRSSPYGSISIWGVHRTLSKESMDIKEIRERHGENPFKHKCVYRGGRFLCSGSEPLPSDIEVFLDEVNTITCVTCLRILACRWRSSASEPFEKLDRFGRLKEMI